MDDDGLLLNFSTDNAAPATSKSNTKVVGGKWRDRRKAQLSARGVTKKDRSKSGANSQPVNHKSSLESVGTVPSISAEQPDASVKSSAPRPVKKRPANNDDETKGPSKQARFTEGRGTAGKNDTYVSSLFTSNPELTERDYTEIETHEPSNAPLADSTSFNGLGVSDILHTHLTQHLDMKHPTKIQRSVLPRLLTRERDLLVQAQTGSGKTLAFVLPIFQKLMEIKDLNRTTGIFALILVPTRELATQIYSVIETLTRCCHRIVPGIVIGGEKKKAEKSRLRKGVNILVATPGRLADHIENTERLDLSNIRYVVLDEGDKLMELGFEETITKILTDIEKTSRVQATTRMYPTLPHKRVNVLCSATMKANVKKLGEISLTNAELVTSNSVPDVEDLELAENVAAPDQLLQQVCVVPPKLRLVSLASILKDITVKKEGSRTIIFLSCTDSVDFHFAVFAKNGLSYNKHTKQFQSPSDQATVITSPLLGEKASVYKLHGALTQPLRTATLSAFSKAPADEHTILFCTDVAARGLDLPYISTVIEYDPPFSTEDHLHRIGRTARAGMSGKSFLFLLPTEEKYLDLIKHYHPNGIQHKSYESLLKLGFGEKWDFDATTWHLNVERWLLEDPGAHEKAVSAFTSHTRAYATHISAEKSVFNLKAVHLGHLAKSFGLRETPKKLGGKSTGGEGSRKKKENPKDKMFRMARMTAKAASDEFNFM